MGERRSVGPRRVATDAVARGFLLAALVWQGGWLLADAEVRSLAFGGPAAGLYLLSAFTWAGLAISVLIRVRPAVRWALAAFDVALVLVGAVGLLALGTPAEDAGSLMNLALGLAFLLLPLRAALPASVVAVGFQVAILLGAFAVPAAGMPARVLSPLYAIATAVAIGTARALAIAAATRTDAERALLDRSTAEAREARAHEARMLAEERRLHESVLNTLTAIARGGFEPGEAMERRCREAAQVVRSLTEPTPAAGPRDPEAELAPALEELRRQGCAVDVTIDAPRDALASVPGEAYDACMAAGREAIANAARHAAAPEAQIRVRARPGAMEVRVRDRGRGFDPRTVERRFGLTRAIEESMTRVGGTSAVRSRTGRGTSVIMRWPARWQERSALSVRAFAVPVLAGFGAYVMASLLLTIGNAAAPAWDVLAFVVLVVLAAVLLSQRRGTALDGWRVLVVTALAPLIHYSQQFAHGTAGLDDWTEWSSAAITVVLIVVVASGPWWAWMPALAAWLVAMGDPIGELMRTGTLVIAASAVFARSVRRSEARADAALTAREAEDAARVESAAAIDRLLARYSALRESQAPTLLLALAEGTLDPADPGVRERCAVEERFIRSVMRLDPAREPIHALAAAVATAARGRGIPLELDVHGFPTLQASDLEPMRVACLQVIGCADPGEPARLTARREGGHIVVRLVVELGAHADPVLMCREVETPVRLHIAEGSAIVEVGLAALTPTGASA